MTPEDMVKAEVIATEMQEDYNYSGDQMVGRLLAAAITEIKRLKGTVAAERAAWASASWAAHNAGYSEQAWTILCAMKATGEVPT